MNGTTLGFRRWVWWALAISSSFWSVGTLLYWNRCQGYQVMMNEQPHRRAAVEEAENEPAFYWLEKVLLHGHSIKPSVSSLPTKLDTFREINSYLERMKSAQQRKAEPGDRELMTRLELDPAPSKARTPVDFQVARADKFPLLLPLPQSFSLGHLSMSGDLLVFTAGRCYWR
ncbi:uncharacterized protein LOC116593182 isoform X4 [Mustela erminea]|uniref:uncharacterized protein LOC116593182 isoform X4 n=1 Tax=Mustela erminea TaxID=36723 RepID=UPI0013866A38|nr:uncharacterized protein LOC116593182 isoform X4 [Mustela erminea]